jgi:hypothetical protein
MCEQVSGRKIWLSVLSEAVCARAGLTGSTTSCACSSFASTASQWFSTRLTLSQGNTVENSGKGNPETGFKSPHRAEEEI